MQVLYERCAGIDGHQKTAVVRILVPQVEGKTMKTTMKTTRTFATMTAPRRERAAWLDHDHLEQVAIASTGGTGGRCITDWKRATPSPWSIRST